MNLRSYQQRAIADLRASYASGHRAPCLVLPTGAGKCLGIGTLVMRSDGVLIPVEDVRAGDALMGPDSKPRRVLSTTRGTGPLHRIVPVKGDAWICNDVHVLTLVHTETGALVDIPVNEYLAETRWFRHLHKQFTPEDGVEFPTAETLPLDPYFLGVWYGDGTKALTGVGISKPDQEIEAVCREVAARFDLQVRTDFGSSGCPTHHIHGGCRGGAPNPLLDLLRAITGTGTHMPRRYLTASRADRLSFLAGLLDTDGYLHRSGFEIVQKQRGFAEGICYLVRSLGLRAAMVRKVVNGADYWRVSISGDCSAIPTRIPRKRAPERRQIKRATRTGFTVETIGPGEYAGFELDGDGRFLLGDFTVTHNTVVAAEIIRSATALGRRVLFLVHRQELQSQSVSKLQAAGVHDIRTIRAASDLGNPLAPVTVASVQTLTTERWLARLPDADLVIFDESHHVVAKTWKRIADRYVASRLLGLTATPQRSDGKPLGDVFDALVVGSTVKELQALDHLVTCRVWAPPSVLQSGENALSPAEAYLQHGGEQRAIVFCATVEHAQEVAASFPVRCEVVHGNLPALERAATLARFAAGVTRALASIHVLTEGFDDPGAAVCILTRKPVHAGTYLQMVGRVLRPAAGKSGAVLLDLCGASLEHGTPEADREYALDGRAIKLSDREPIRQCPTCGGVFIAGGDGCPHCGSSMPRRPIAPPRSVGVGLVETGEIAPPARVWTVEMVAKFPGKCSACGGRVERGQPIWWTKERVRHADCSAPNTTALDRANQLLARTA